MALHDSINIDTVGEPINREIGVHSDTILARAFWSSERPQYRGVDIRQQYPDDMLYSMLVSLHGYSRYCAKK
jgi:hypothetical protein